MAFSAYLLLQLDVKLIFVLLSLYRGEGGEIWVWEYSTTAVPVLAAINLYEMVLPISMYIVDHSPR